MPRLSGTVAKWLNHKGIGFITPEGEAEGENDILVHFEQIKQSTEDGFKSLEQGAVIEYELEDDPKNADKKVAVNVTGPEGADCPPRKKGKGKGRSEKGESKGEKGEGKGEGKGKGKGKKGKGKGKGKKGKGKGKGEEPEDE